MFIQFLEIQFRINQTIQSLQVCFCFPRDCFFILCFLCIEKMLCFFVVSVSTAQSLSPVFAPFTPPQCYIPSAASIRAGLPNYSSPALISQIQAKPHVDIQYHGLLMTNLKPVVLQGVELKMELSKSGFAPWNAESGNFICTDQYSLDECFNTNISFERSMFTNGDLERIHLTSILVPAWVCLTKHFHPGQPVKRAYFKFFKTINPVEFSDSWTRYGFVYRFMFSGTGETDLFERGSQFMLICDHNLQSLGYRICGSFNSNLNASALIAL